jgi:hypothetical protein
MVWTEGAGAVAEQPITVTAMATPIPASSTRDLRAALVRTVLPPKDPAVTGRPDRPPPINPHVVKEGYLAGGGRRTEPSL